MPVVNFTIPKQLDKRILQTMKEKGVASRSEFFRFAAIYFMDVIEKPFAEEDARFDYLVSNLKKELKGYGKKKLSSAREQLADL